MIECFYEIFYINYHTKHIRYVFEFRPIYSQKVLELGPVSIFYPLMHLFIISFWHLLFGDTRMNVGQSR